MLEFLSGVLAGLLIAMIWFGPRIFPAGSLKWPRVLDDLGEYRMDFRRAVAAKRNERVVIPSREPQSGGPPSCSSLPPMGDASSFPDTVPAYDRGDHKTL